jgi:glycogen phosphorylase
MFRDIERLKRILNGPTRPVQVIFSGKAHPSDEPGNDLIRAVIHYTMQPGPAGQITFLEVYAIEDARGTCRYLDDQSTTLTW